MSLSGSPGQRLSAVEMSHLSVKANAYMPREALSAVYRTNSTGFSDQFYSFAVNVRGGNTRFNPFEQAFADSAACFGSVFYT